MTIDSLRPAALVAAFVLVAAGCAAPTASGPGDTPSVATRGGNLSFDPGLDYARLRALLGTNVSAPPSVEVVEESTLPDRNVTAGRPPAVFRAFGVVPRPEDRDDRRYRYVAETGTTGVIRLYPGQKPTPLVRTILVHEYVHYVQVRRGDPSRLQESVPVDTTDGLFVYRATLEGVAVAATDDYVERYLPEAVPNARLYDRLNAAVPRGTPAWYGIAVYRFGARYVESRADDPAEVLSVVERPPRTSEQIIHAYSPDAEPPRSLSVRVSSRESDWSPVGRDRLGEAFLRASLGDLTPDRARRAAAGWGVDELVVFRAPGERNASYVLVTRWDDAANATEFGRAYRDALSARGTEQTVGWRVDGRRATVERVSDTTVAVLIGPRSFVRGTEVEGAGDTVTVDPPDD